jgi:integrase
MAQTIRYPDALVKGRKGFTQPLDERLLPALTEIIAERRRIGALTLCDVPKFGASLAWRALLDKLGFKHLIFHSLRATWVTRAALAGIPESVAQRFSNHGSVEVHRIYQRFQLSDLRFMLKRLG